MVGLVAPGVRLLQVGSEERGGRGVSSAAIPCASACGVPPLRMAGWLASLAAALYLCQIAVHVHGVQEAHMASQALLGAAEEAGARLGPGARRGHAGALNSRSRPGDGVEAAPTSWLAEQGNMKRRAEHAEARPSYDGSPISAKGVDQVSAASLALLGEEGVWSVWRISDGPYRGFESTTVCRWAVLQPPPTYGLQAPINGSICLRPAGDLLSDALAAGGHWDECDDLPELYTIGRSHGMMPERAAILDVGMNIGACTLHLLLATDAQARTLPLRGVMWESCTIAWRKGGRRLMIELLRFASIRAHPRLP